MQLFFNVLIFVFLATLNQLQKPVVTGGYTYHGVGGFTFRILQEIAEGSRPPRNKNDKPHNYLNDNTTMIMNLLYKYMADEI